MCVVGRKGPLEEGREALLDVIIGNSHFIGHNGKIRKGVQILLQENILQTSKKDYTRTKG